MQQLPHVYAVRARGQSANDLAISAAGLPDIASAAPPEFDGPGGRWSPESLLSASVASCFILTFRAIARASKLAWRELDCAVDGKLERKDGVTQFTHFATRAVLVIDPTADRALAQRLLEKAEHGCLVANSLKSDRSLTTEIRQGE